MFFASKKKWDEATFFDSLGPNETELFCNSDTLGERVREAIPRPDRCCLDKSKIDDYPMADDIVTGIVIVGASGPVNEVLLQN